jgi:hypothetical protein
MRIQMELCQNLCCIAAYLHSLPLLAGSSGRQLVLARPAAEAAADVQGLWL